MTSYYDEIEIEDMEYNEDEETYYFPCPCGDKFQITNQELMNGDEIAHCPSCSLIIRYLIH
jgi:diphthamide biosynthesis protein 3